MYVPLLQDTLAAFEALAAFDEERRRRNGGADGVGDALWVSVEPLLGHAAPLTFTVDPPSAMAMQTQQVRYFFFFLVRICL